jgi:hypothetical protein
VADDDRLHDIDSVNANHFGVRHHRKSTVVRVRGPAEPPANALHRSRVAGTQDDQHASPALHRVNSRSECLSIVTGHHEIDGSGHRVALAATTRTNDAARRRERKFSMLSACCRIALEEKTRDGHRRGLFQDSDSHP